MSHTGDDQPMTTWDGKPVSDEKPHGASVIVYRRAGDAYEYLILHRAHNGPDDDPHDDASLDDASHDEGDWAWTPPAGARLPGEPVDDCARRELKEETGLALPVRRTDVGSEEWAIYVSEASASDVITLDDEHDRYEWVTVETAAAKCLPRQVGSRFLQVAARSKY